MKQMNKNFQKRIDKLSLQFETLKKCKPINRDDLLNRRNPIDIPDRGIYLFSENNSPIYVGRTDRMRKRLLEHGRLGAGYHDASFAFKLTKEKAGKSAIGRTTTELIGDEKFSKLFAKERDRVAKMNIQYIEIKNPVDQCLFEVYASVILKTPYNDFENH